MKLCFQRWNPEYAKVTRVTVKNWSEVEELKQQLETNEKGQRFYRFINFDIPEGIVESFQKYKGKNIELADFQFVFSDENTGHILQIVFL